MKRKMLRLAVLVLLVCTGALLVVTDSSASDAGSRESRVVREAPTPAAATVDGSVSKGGPAWKDEEHKRRCEMFVSALRINLSKARDLSIQGDSCGSAEHAQLFQEDLAEAEKACPAGFLTRSGFSDRVVRNVKTLYVLGKKRCRRPEGSVPP